ncbi:MAG TPA: coenzyme F420-0:L-glutamate ligase [Caulobacteraceae bacterium]|jgi:coenzyme F420-0:L-glutamate ligase/NADPH-dependent F420 reductase|nr:coenzyme F420-0:L-glutamate ligase [Caulobacteraceae bacterium]
MTSIAILGGAGALGGALAGRLARVGHTVWIGSRDPAKAQAFSQALDGGSAGGRVRGGDYRACAAEAEICILTVPYAAHAETLNQVKDLLFGKIVIDTTVPLRPPKVGTVQLPAAGSAAVEAQAILGPDVRVVSALQNIGAEKLAAGQAVDGDVLAASDDVEAAATVCALLAQIGLRAWHVGPLANSAAAEAMTSVLIQINRRYKRVQAGIRITGKAKADAEGVAKSAGISIHPLHGLPLFKAGDDLAEAIAEGLVASGLAPEDGDVVVVAQKVFSKVEGRAVALADVTATPKGAELARQSGKPEALAELIVAESSELMRVRDNLVITRHRLGHVTANAGIDASNVADPEGPETVLLWPVDPDASAARLRAALRERFGVRLAVIMSDSLGRAWRAGTMGTAIGAAGLKPIRDRCGESDLFGRELKATLVAVADEIAAAASLVIGEAAEGTPAALVRGAIYEPCEEAVALDLLRPLEQDLFR